MGLFSSWSTMALTHHFIVNGLCEITHDNYRLVGDDLLIADQTDSYERYLEIMSDIGLKVNLSKTIISEGNKHNIEFARNYIINSDYIKNIRYGAIFAWIDGNINSESAVWHLRDFITLENVNDVYNLFNDKPNHKLKISLYYYLWRESILTNENIEYLLSTIDNVYITLNTFTHIKSICTTIADKFKRKEWVSNSFYDTLLSQSVVRKESELEYVTKFAESIAMIAFAEDALVEPAERFHRRLLDANLIKYDVDLSGGPMLSKRERSLINDVIDLPRDSQIMIGSH